MEEMEVGSVVTLLDESGNEVQFDLLFAFNYEGKRYIALLPIDPLENVEEDEVVLLEVVTEKGEESYRTIENPILLEEVFDEFSELFEEYISQNDEE